MNIKEKIRIAHNNRCMFCGWRKLSELLHIAHKTPKKQGGILSLDNTVLLCPTCHRMYDFGFISLKDIYAAYQTRRERMSILKLLEYWMVGLPWMVLIVLGFMYAVASSVGWLAILIILLSLLSQEPTTITYPGNLLVLCALTNLIVVPLFIGWAEEGKPKENVRK